MTGVYMELEKLNELYKPLVELLMPIAMEMDINAVSKENRSIELDKNKYEKQFKYGINRCIGFDIVWIIK